MILTRALIATTALTAAMLGTSAVAEDGKDTADKKAKKAEGHCEMSTGGKTEDIDAPADVADPKKWCKEQGGKWEKGKKHDHDK